MEKIFDLSTSYKHFQNLCSAIECAYMSDNKFNFCPNCGGKNIEYRNGKKWFCPDCQFDLYNNVASATGAVIYDSNNTVLFEVRAKNPRKGFLALPGGFTDRDETAEEAVVRECAEETGYKISEVKYLCSFPNDYEYRGIAYKTCDLFFAVKLPDGTSVQELIKQLSNEKSEVVSFEAHKIESEADVENLPLAFSSANKALKKWLSEKA